MVIVESDDGSNIRCEKLRRLFQPLLLMIEVV